MLTLEQLRRVCPLASVGRLAVFVEPLNEAMDEFFINTPARQAAFVAQVAHESGGFRYVREIASGAAYDERADLGNTKPEAVAIAGEHGSTPGRWWRGHGLMQITGYDNHLACGLALDLDLLHQPALLEEPLHAARSAAWFWHRKNLNALADRNDQVAFELITRRINGGVNGLKDRTEYWERARVALA